MTYKRGSVIKVQEMANFGPDRVDRLGTSCLCVEANDISYWNQKQSLEAIVEELSELNKGGGIGANGKGEFAKEDFIA